MERRATSSLRFTTTHGGTVRTGTRDFGVNHAAVFVSGSVVPPHDPSTGTLIKPSLSGRVQHRQPTGHLVAQVAMPDAKTGRVGGTAAFASDVGSTARLSAIALSPGLVVHYGSGSACMAGITQAGTVPEPPAA